MEEWRALPNLWGYLVSNLGRVWRKHIIEAYSNRAGYATVNLYINGARTSRTVHVLVLEAFVGPQPEGYRPCHKDGNKQNNNVNNLHWVRRSTVTCTHEEET